MILLKRKASQKLSSCIYHRLLSTNIQSLYDDNVLRTYDRLPIEIASGHGSYIIDSDGRSFLDFGSGIAVNALGYNHPMWIASLTKQASRLCHVSNLYYTKEQGELAEKLVRSCCLDKAFFCNSGAEANEAAIKFARRYSRNMHNIEGKSTVVGFSGSFHGRTIGSLSLTANKKYREPFEPLLPGTKFGTYNDPDALDELLTDDVCGVIVEPVQGEGGVTPAKSEFLHKLRQKTKEIGALLIADEVQCGFGRLGKLWAHEFYELKPDMMTVAKPLAGGLPIGAVMLKNSVASQIQVGDHGTTFGGNALISAVASDMCDFINTPEFLGHVQATGDELRMQIKEKIEPFPFVKEVRHIGGLMCGIELTIPVKDILSACREQGILFLGAGPNVVRMLPPLIITKEEVIKAVDTLAEAMHNVVSMKQ